MRTLMLSIFLAFSFLAGIGFAQQSGVGSACSSNLFGIQQLSPWYCSNIDSALYGVFEQWLPIGMAVIMVAFMIAALIFIFGIALKNGRIREFGVGEMYEATASAIIIIAFMFITSVMIGLTPALFTGPANPYVTSLTYISQTMGDVNHLITSLFNVYTINVYYTTLNLDISVPQSSASQVPSSVTKITGTTGEGGQAAGLTSTAAKIGQQAFAAGIEIFFIIPAQTYAYLLMEAQLVLSIEYYLLLFGMYAAIPVFLIPGVILRAIAPTRSIGGMFMAIAIGFFFIMPVLFSVAFFFTQAGVASSLTTASNQLQQFGQGTGAEQNAISATSPLVTTLNNLQGSMGAFWLSVLFYPALIMAITYFAITTIADFIGGFAHGAGSIVGKM